MDNGSTAAAHDEVFQPTIEESVLASGQKAAGRPEGGASLDEVFQPTTEESVIATGARAVGRMLSTE